MKNPLPLHVIVDRISISSISSATQRHSFIVNDVPADMQVTTDENMLATVLGSLLNTIITHSKNCCIRVSAKLFGKVALIQLKETHSFNDESFNGNIRQLQNLAEKIGGTISICRDRSKETTVVFSFANDIPLAA